VSIRFEPWVGDRYDSGGLLGVRTLVLGESHYGESEDASSQVTRGVVQQWAMEKRSAFFTKVAKLLLNLPAGHWLSDETRAAFWHSVAFYNYVQEFPGASARIRPTEAMWQAARPAFFEMLNRLRPAAIIVLGFELWSRLPDPSSLQQVDDQTFKVYGGDAFTPRVLAARVQHPSSGGFSYAPWSERVQALLDNVRLPQRAA
jgi:hypothetical protein